MSATAGFTPTCPSGKKGYASRKAAKGAMSEIRRSPNSYRFQGKFAAYRCDHCGFWHVGHMPGWKRAGLERPEGYGVSDSATDTP